jgi:hypothetical protein
MPRLKGFDEIQLKFKAISLKYTKGGNKVIDVGFTMPYAIYVHEIVENHHDVGQAKFLTTPFREGRKTMLKIIKDSMKNGQALGSALALAGNWLKNRAVQLCPISPAPYKDYSSGTGVEVQPGRLRASAYVKVK